MVDSVTDTKNTVEKSYMAARTLWICEEYTK